MTPDSIDVYALSLTALDEACDQERQRFRRGQPNDDRFCLEIFRRALQHAAIVPGTTDAPHYADDEARNVLVLRFSDYVRAQISRYAAREMARDDLEQLAWRRFWQAANNGISFPSLDAALFYLKRVAVSAVAEARRDAIRRRKEESLTQLRDADSQEEHDIPDVRADLFDQHTRRRFLARSREVLRGPYEFHVFTLRYSLGLSPREIAQCLNSENVLLRNEAPTAAIVSATLARSIRTLAEDREIRDLLRSD